MRRKENTALLQKGTELAKELESKSFDYDFDTLEIELNKVTTQIAQTEKLLTQKQYVNMMLSQLLEI